MSTEFDFIPAARGMAFLFPGQGSQSIGMGRAVADAYPVAAATFAEADDALGFKLSALCFDGPEAELTDTVNAQPALLVTSIALLRALDAELGGAAAPAQSTARGSSEGRSISQKRKIADP